MEAELEGGCQSDQREWRLLEKEEKEEKKAILSQNPTALKLLH